MVVFKTWKHLLFRMITSVAVWNLDWNGEEMSRVKSQASRQQIKDWMKSSWLREESQLEREAQLGPPAVSATPAETPESEVIVGVSAPAISRPNATKSVTSADTTWSWRSSQLSPARHVELRGMRSNCLNPLSLGLVYFAAIDKWSQTCSKWSSKAVLHMNLLTKPSNQLGLDCDFWVCFHEGEGHWLLQIVDIVLLNPVGRPPLRLFGMVPPPGFYTWGTCRDNTRCQKNARVEFQTLVRSAWCRWKLRQWNQLRTVKNQTSPGWNLRLPLLFPILSWKLGGQSNLT